MLRELGKVVSFVLSVVALYAVLGSAFFRPGSRWQERLLASVMTLAFAACVCFASGIVFALAGGEGSGRPVQPAARTATAEPRITRTLPVQLFFWTATAAALLFLISWYLEEYYVPLLWRN